MIATEIRKAIKDYPFFFYCLSTSFMVFLSVYAIQNWPNFWAQISISFVCLLTLAVTLKRELPHLLKSKTWPVEIKWVLTILFLGTLNICFSENNWQSLKGMGLFLMSGISVFLTTFFLFQSEKNKEKFFILCTFCFFILIIYGFYEFSQKLSTPYKPGHPLRILLFSSNPIPAGSMLILLSLGPISLLTYFKSGWKRNLLTSSLAFGVIVIILIGQRGPLISLMLMTFLWAITKRKRLVVFLLISLIAAGITYNAKDQIPIEYKNRIYNEQTLLIRLEFLLIAMEVLKEKPLFGLGFNSPLSKFIPKDYESKIFPKNKYKYYKPYLEPEKQHGNYSFINMITGATIFDNMALTFLGETGGLFSAAYFCLIFYLINNKAINCSDDEKRRFGLLLIVLSGFLAHSMTFDSLKYPHINWIFHSFLGLLTENKRIKQGISSGKSTNRA